MNVRATNPRSGGATSDEKSAPMFEASEPATHPPAHRRQTKFTPENIRQIENLIDRGKSAEEIAEIIGVTPGTLKSTCSKLHISLRRPRFDMGTGLLRHRRRPTCSASHETERGAGQPDADHVVEESTPKFERLPTDQEPTVVPQSQSRQQTSATFAILMSYKGEKRTLELPLTDRMIAYLAIEAEFRATTVTELIASLITKIAMNDKFDVVFEHSR
jgi:hypothetical protein